MKGVLFIISLRKNPLERKIAIGAKETKSLVSKATWPAAAHQRQCDAQQATVVDQRLSCIVILNRRCALGLLHCASVQIFLNHSKSYHNPQNCYIFSLQVSKQHPKAEFEFTLVFFTSLACLKWNPSFSSLFFHSIVQFSLHHH